MRKTKMVTVVMVILQILDFICEMSSDAPTGLQLFIHHEDQHNRLSPGPNPNPNPNPYFNPNPNPYILILILSLYPNPNHANYNLNHKTKP